LVDLENEKNEEYSYKDIISVDAQKKPWGTVLFLKIRIDEKEKTFQLSLVKDWVSYPIKDAVKFLTVNWTPIVEYIRQRITK
jgi:hypothetical protein